MPKIFFQLNQNVIQAKNKVIHCNHITSNHLIFVPNIILRYTGSIIILPEKILEDIGINQPIP